MKRTAFLAAAAAATTALSCLAAPGAQAVTQVSSSPFNPRGVDWPADYAKLPAQAPVATFSNGAGTARCGVYNVDGQSFVKCLSTVDSMPGHMCSQRGQVNAMLLGTGDAWDCANPNDFAGAPPIGPLQVRRFGDIVVYSDARNNFIVGYANLTRAVRVGEINDIYLDRGRIQAFNSPLRGSSIPAGSSL